MYNLSDFTRASHDDKNKQENTDLLTLLTRKWDEKHESGDVFRYKIDKLQEKIINGYLLQLNPDRCCKRRTPELIDNICQPFDGSKFNFTKVSIHEVLFMLQNDLNTDIHSILVNVSPVSRYHSLICPSVAKCLPQIVTQESLELVIQLMFLVKDRSFRIGFNSLCGFASVNHLHYHIFIENHSLPVETAKCNHLYGPVYYLDEDYPIPAFCFEIYPNDSITKIANNIFKIIEYLLKKSIAHNIFVTRGASVNNSDNDVMRFLIWPRKSTAGVKQMTSFNVALLEVSGWFPIYNADEFENLQSLDLENELKKWRIDNFEELCKDIKLLYQ